MTAHAHIKFIEYALPESACSNENIASEFPEWSIEKIAKKTGIHKRHVVAEGQTVTDLAVEAAQKIFSNYGVKPEDIDYLILCTQTPDYFLPASACIIQHRLGLPTHCAAIDVNQGCSGYVYGLGLCEALIHAGQARNILFITAETYSRHMKPDDKTVKTIFGDAACATLLSAATEPSLTHFVYGTDGAGACNLIVSGGLGRSLAGGKGGIETPHDKLWMDGPEIFSFTLRAVPSLIDKVLANAGGLSLDKIDLVVLHQANKFMLDALAQRIGVPDEKLLRCYEGTGNTVSSTIPIALAHAKNTGKLQPGMQLLLAGFGVGYSWAGCLVKCPPFDEESV